MGLAGIAALTAACADEEAVTVQIPAGTELDVSLASPLSSDATRAGDTFEALLAAPVVLGGTTLLAEGSHVHGRIVDVLPSGAVEADGARLTLVVDLVELEGGRTQSLGTEPIRFVATRSLSGLSSGVAGAVSRSNGGATLHANAGAGGAAVVHLAPTEGEVLLRTGQRIRFLTREATEIRTSAPSNPRSSP